MGVVLDSSVLIAGERRGESVRQILERMRSKHGEADAALSVVTIVELTHGIYRAKTDADRARRRAFSEGLRRDMVVHPVTVEIAELAGRIGASRQREALGSPSKIYLSAQRPCTLAMTWRPSMRATFKQFPAFPSCSSESASDAGLQRAWLAFRFDGWL